MNVNQTCNLNSISVYQYINWLSRNWKNIFKNTPQKRLCKDATHVQPLNSQGSLPILGAADGAHQPQAVEPCQGLEWIGCFRPLVTAINQIYFYVFCPPQVLLQQYVYNHYSRCAFFDLNWWTWEDNNAPNIRSNRNSGDDNHPSSTNVPCHDL